MITNCPGAERFKQPVPENIRCPRCNKELEIWSDEFEVKCPACNMDVKRGGGQQSCLDWCSMAKEKVLNIRISDTDKKLLERDAKEEKRSISNLLLWCWEQWRKGKKRK